MAPGNAGIADLAECAALDIENSAAVVGFATANAIDFVIIGPEAPLVAGVSDDLRTAGFLVFGPSKAAAALEGSKNFTKQICDAVNAPTAAYGHFTHAKAAKDYIRTQGAPIVVKADGLAAGKGVIVAETLAQAEAAVTDMLSGNAFGEAGCRVVIEEFLPGEEASFIVMVDGSNVLPMATSQDHKRIGEGDTGPNTGGMGAYSPAPVVDSAVYDRVMKDVILPSVAGMAAEGNDYTGFLYAGLMISPTGEPKVIEYNCRFGDPETQPVMVRLQSDLAVLCIAALDGELDMAAAEWDSRCAIGVVLAAGGYPGDYKKGLPIDGLDAEHADNIKVFHAGTSTANGQVVTSGGRVLCVTALGSDIAAAQRDCYSAAQAISWEGMTLRRDIGWRAIARHNQAE